MSKNNPNNTFLQLPENMRSMRINEQGNSKAGGKLKPDLGGILNIIETDNSNKPKMIVCVVGGISYSEMRAIHNMDAFRDKIVITGGTEFLTPNQYIQSIKNMKEY